ncbi:hypothetical protein SELMODRAFT_450934, partial [Selaginella moellendorffii]
MTMRQAGILDAPNGAGAGIGGESGKLSQRGEGWENLPPYRQLKVLLVEDDDSTRHVVAALLRNCGYQVVPAANGLQAWSLLDDRNREIDLVLTDVVMPGLSGLGLLSKIMHHKNHQKVPVVMMSSHDSTNVVFKCLTKGAADFLVKPVRKNELKNLWQHAWRKARSSSGSESETGRLNKCGGSCGELSSDSGSEEIRISDQSDTESSCTKKVAELESPRKSRPRAFTKPKPCPPSRRARRTKDSDTVDDVGARLKPADSPADTDRAMEAVDLIGNIAEPSTAKAAEEFESEMGASNSPEVILERDVSSSDPAPTSGNLELALKSPTPDHAYEPSYVLNQSGPSAFSRSNDQAAAAAAAATAAATAAFFARPEQQHHIVTPVQYATVLSYDQSLPARGGATYYYTQPALPPWQHAFSPPQQQPRLDNPDFVEQQQRQQQHFVEQQQRQQQQQHEEQKHRSFQALTNIMAHHHHYHIEHHHHDKASGSNELETPGCGSTNVAGDGSGGVGGGELHSSLHASNNNGGSGNGNGWSSYGNNGSVSGSNHGSNNVYNDSTAKMSNFGSCCNGGDSNPGSNNCGAPAENAANNSKVRREAALNKFRQKRKERCFEKKVRYQSRKRLAEQRPRVRGQFVSQAVFDS